MLKAGATLKSDHAVQSLSQFISKYLLKQKNHKLSGLLLSALSLWSWAIGTFLVAPCAFFLFSFHCCPPGKRGRCHHPTHLPGVGDHDQTLPPPGPHSHISCSSPQPPTVFCLIRLVLAPCLTFLPHTCEQQWDSSFPTNWDHPLYIPWLRWQLATWSPYPQPGQTGLQQNPLLILVPSLQPTHVPWSPSLHWTQHHVWGLSRTDSSTITFNYSAGQTLQRQLVLSAAVSLGIGGAPVPVPKQSSCVVQPCHVLTTSYFLISTQ